MTTKAQQKAAEQEEARATLRELLPPGSTVYTILRHVSRSGMARDIDCYVMQDGEPRWISSLVSKATGIPFNAKAEALRVGGCGMDMGFHVVYELSHYLYRGGFGCIGEKCPSNDHSNGDRDYTPHNPEQQTTIHVVLDGSGTRRGEFTDRERARQWAAQENMRDSRYQEGGQWTVTEETRTGHYHKSGGYALRHRWM